MMSLDMVMEMGGRQLGQFFFNSIAIVRDFILIKINLKIKNYKTVLVKKSKPQKCLAF